MAEPILPALPHNGFFVWREFIWGAMAGAFGEGIMHPVDTIKTRLQSQSVFTGSQAQKNIVQMVKMVWAADGYRADWWRAFGDDTPELTKFAKKVLSLTCSASGCERNWSSFNQVHTKRRNHLTQAKLNDLVYVMFNLKLKQREVKKKTVEDPLCLEDVDSGDEWISEFQTCEHYAYHELDANTPLEVDAAEAEEEQDDSRRKKRKKGFYRGVTPAVTGSLATGATYFGIIESTKKWVESKHPNLGGHWAHFIAGGVGDTLGSFVYVPCEVLKQRMQVQGTRKSWASTLHGHNSCQKGAGQVYCYYSGMFQAGNSIWKDCGFKGLYTGYWSTLARDVPFAGLMVTFYEALKTCVDSRNNKRLPIDLQMSTSCEGLLLGGLAGGFAAYLTTPLDVIKTRLQVQGSAMRYNGWLDAISSTWKSEGLRGMFKGSIPRIMWYIPASSLTFMAVEFLREQLNEAQDTKMHEIANISLDATCSNLHETA